MQRSELVSDCDVRTVRILEAPRERVFEAMTDPLKLARWWGPQGFTNTFHEYDLRPGGAWRFVMHGPDGTDYKNHSVFTEVTKPDKLAFRHVSGPVYQASFSLEDLGDRTKIVWQMHFDNPKFLAQQHAVVLQGNEDNMDRLSRLLSQE